jgi:isopenicillin-N epimerase
MNFGKETRNLFLLKEDIKFLNHGSFGGTPKKVMDAFIDYNYRLEQQPINFLLEEYPILLQITYQKLAGFLRTSPENLVFVENATNAINNVLSYLENKLKAGDEIVITNHVYPAVKNALIHLSKKIYIEIIEVDLMIPISDEDEIIEEISSHFTERTKILIIDHITSPTAVVFPVEKLIKLCNERGIINIIDGAHAPGQIFLNIDEIQPDFYTGNCHKWLYNPKGAAFLYVAPAYQKDFHPLVISNNYMNGFREEFEWIGTRNPTAYLTVTDSIDFYNSLGQENIITYCHNLALQASKLIAEKTGAEIIAPADMTANMVSFCLNTGVNGCSPIQNSNADELRKYFYHNYGIEVPFMNISNEILFRISAQIYNYLEEYEYFADKLNEFLEVEK